jgi:hypothetical protein
MAQIAQFPGLGMYDEGGKFEVKQEFIDEARAKAIKEGKKYYGDSTNFEVFRDSVLNLPDAAINFVARGAEGTGELVAGIASLAMKGGQLATTTDPDKITQIMSEPSFTKYMGAFRDKIPTSNLYESNISGMEDTEKAFGTAGYYAAPVPVVPIAKGATQVAKGLASTNVGKNIADELGTAATYFPEYTPFKNIEPKSVGAKATGNEFFDYGYRFKPSDKAPTNPLGELKEAEFNRLKKEIESPKISKGENIVIDTSVREQPTTEIISGSFDGINKRLPLKTKVKEGGSKVYRRKEEISDPYLNNISKNEKITDYFEKIGEGSDHQTFLIRAHQLEQSAVGKIKKAGFSLPRNFSIYEMIPQKQLKYMLSESRNYDPRYAQTISTQTRNREHQKAGGDLIAQLVTKYDAMGYTFKPFTDKRGGVWVFNKNKVKSPEKIEEINAEMVKSIDKINDLKVPVMFYNPAKNRMVTYGEPPKNVSVDLRKSVEEKGYAYGGMVGISHLTRPL